jgi:hypothetical protein
MLTLNKIEWGLVPYGPATGKRALLIDFGENDEVFDSNNEKTLYQEFKNKIVEIGYSDYYLSAVNGSHSTFLFFIGGSIEKDVHQAQWDQFNLLMTRDSIDVQKTLRLSPDKLKPPFCIWAGTPTVFSSKRQFYQYFNCIYAILDEKSNFSPLALQEVLNHQFSIIAYKIQDTFTSVEKLGEFNLVNKLNLIDMKNLEYAREYALQNNYRYYLYTDLDLLLKF